MDLPKAFAQRMQKLFSETEYEEFVSSLQEPPAVSVRLNESKGAKWVDNMQPVPWCKTGCYLPERPSFTFDPLFHTGAYYVQEASSMFVEQAFKCVGTPQMVLDLCAAPGGKSTLIRSLLQDDAFLVCNEPIRLRTQILTENMQKWGHEGVMVTANYPKDFGSLGAIFDVIVVDAPCSGEGMFRKDNPALELWSEDNVRNCALRQKEILNDVWLSLKEGGYMVYSTCTYNVEENEENVQYICNTLGAEVVEVPTMSAWNVCGSLLQDKNIPVYHFFPHRTKGEGFFMALLRKISGGSSAHIKSKTNFKPLDKQWQQKLEQGRYYTLEKEDTIYAIREEDVPVISFLQKKLYITTVGIPMYTPKGNKQVPHHALAMSRLLKKDAFPKAEVSLEQALDYLHCSAMNIEAPKGYVLLTYKGFPLGFVNNLGTRANNLYPQAWRIRSANPEALKSNSLITL